MSDSAAGVDDGSETMELSHVGRKELLQVVKVGGSAVMVEDSTTMVDDSVIAVEYVSVMVSSFESVPEDSSSKVDEASTEG